MYQVFSEGSGLFRTARPLIVTTMNMCLKGRSIMVQMNGVNAAFMSNRITEMPDKTKTYKPTGGRGEVILAIEDEEMLRDFLQTILGEDGYKVILAADGAEGVRKFTEHVNEISLVLLDMGLPRLSGEEVLSMIITARPDVKVIAVSGSIEPEVESGAILTGAAAYLSKPYLTNQLLQKVDNVLHEGPRQKK